MMNVMRAVLDTPPLAIQKKVASSMGDEGPQQVESSGGPLGITLSEIDRLIANVVPEINTEGTIAAETSASKGKRTKGAFSEDKSFDLWHLGGQQLSEDDIFELKNLLCLAATNLDLFSSAPWMKRF
jgi:hypothetical protein